MGHLLQLHRNTYDLACLFHGLLKTFQIEVFRERFIGKTQCDVERPLVIFDGKYTTCHRLVWTGGVVRCGVGPVYLLRISFGPNLGTEPILSLAFGPRGPEIINT